MITTIITLVCNIITFCCLLVVSFWCKKLRNYNKRLVAENIDLRMNKESIFKQALKIARDELKIRTLIIRQSKPFDYRERKFLENNDFEYIKRNMANELADKLTEDNIFQVRVFDNYYEGKIDFVERKQGGINGF